MTAEQKFLAYIESQGKMTFEEAMAKWNEFLEPEAEENRRSETRTAEDDRILGRLRWKL